VNTATANAGTGNFSRSATLAAIVGAAGICLYLLGFHGWRQAALFGVGLGAGVALYHAAFGFTGAWREVASSGRSAGLRAQMIMMALTVLVFTPVIAQGEIGGMAVRGNVSPLNLAVVCGAFVFGIGMQLGGGCASGTLFTAGGGNARMLITLAAFVAGSVIGTWHWSQWQDVPGLAPVALSASFGAGGGILLSLALFGAVWLLAARYEKARRGSIERGWGPVSSRAWLTGPWPLLAGALALALVNIATLLLAGRPWGVTSAFALWGAKLAAPMGIDVSQWAYWQRPNLQAALEASVFNDITSVMNFGILLGALVAAGLAGKFAPSLRIPARPLLAAVIGGLMLGYGARIAFGCNIGAFFSGISSTSLHGWLWFVAAFAGSLIGTRLRPHFGLG